MAEAPSGSVVVIEDHPEHLEYVVTLLRRAGHSVDGFTSAAAAMRHIALGATRLIITDVFMPDMDGFEVLKALQRTHPHIPVIAVTGAGSRQALFLEAMRHMGARAGFTKPIDAAALLAAVARLLGEAPARVANGA